MGFDDPIVIILAIGVIVMLFGSKKIPEFAKSLGQARKAFNEGLKEVTKPIEQQQEE